MRRKAPINFIVCAPSTPEGKEILEDRIAEAQAELIFQRIYNMDCSNARKQKILEAVTQAVAEELEEET